MGSPDGMTEVVEREDIDNLKRKMKFLHTQTKKEVWHVLLLCYVKLCFYVPTRGFNIQ